ncbi:hypothetical protein [Flavobacterium notoginsengisoli]|uniref:hypothetical protein n=1 Tax=Flavobacterium notoginsengisoli TaxID=1478199 RepID=UPI0036381474
MKTILLCIIIPVFFISCSAEPDAQTSVNLPNADAGAAAQTGGPANPANPYDKNGAKVYSVLNEYYKNSLAPNSVSELAGQIRFVAENFYNNRNTTGRLIPLSDEMVQSIMEDPDNSMISIVQNSVLQSQVKTGLIAFLQGLILKRQQEFDITYSYIVQYESDVLADVVFSNEEKETILTICSISRYSLYSEEERKDKDWDILIGNKRAKRFFSAGEAPLISVIALLEGCF